MTEIDSLIFIAPYTNQISNLLTKSFPKGIGTSVVAWSNITDNISNEKNYLFYVDFHSTTEQIRHLNQSINTQQNCFVVVYNSPLIVSTTELAQFGKLRGFFYQSSTIKQIYSGTNKLIAGKYQLPKAIVEQLFEYYQTTIVRFGDPFVLNLTSRERDVLNKLKQGMTNFELADRLFVSEYTVKSHLYQIFKKLKVKNRNQAIAWAYKYLP